MIDVLNEITRLRLNRSWSEYELAKRAGIPQSTISTWYRKRQLPTLPSLEKLCEGFGITLSQFFAEAEEPVLLTPEERELLDCWTALPERQRTLLLELLRSFLSS